MKSKSPFKFALIALFSLSFFSCNDLGDTLNDLTIDVPIQETKLFRVEVSQEQYDELLANNNNQAYAKEEGSFKASEDHIEEYGDRAKEFDIQEIRLKALNVRAINGQKGIVFGFCQNCQPETQITIPALQGGVILEVADSKLEEIKEKILNKEQIPYSWGIGLQGPIQMDLEITIVGTLKVTAVE